MKMAGLFDDLMSTPAPAAAPTTAAPAPMDFDDPITAAAYAKSIGAPTAPAPNMFSDLMSPPGQSAPAASGWILPVSWDAAGNPGFDSNAGLVGMGERALESAWSGATLPGDVATGKVDPNSPDAIARSFDLAGVASPIKPGRTRWRYGNSRSDAGVHGGEGCAPDRRCFARCRQRRL